MSCCGRPLRHHSAHTSRRLLGSKLKKKYPTVFDRFLLTGVPVLLKVGVSEAHLHQYQIIQVLYVQGWVGISVVLMGQHWNNLLLRRFDCVKQRWNINPSVYGKEWWVVSLPFSLCGTDKHKEEQFRTVFVKSYLLKVFNLAVVIVPVISHHHPLLYEHSLSCFRRLSSASCPSQWRRIFTPSCMHVWVWEQEDNLHSLFHYLWRKNWFSS